MTKIKIFVATVFGLLAMLTLSCRAAQHEVVKPNEAVRQCEVEKNVETTSLAYKSYPVSVDYGRSLDQMVWAGKYDLMTDTEISVDNFQNQGKDIVEVNLYLITLGHNSSDEGAVRELDKLGYKPAKIEHLLAFGAKYPEKQREYPIVSLGSNYVDPLGRHYVNFLDSRYSSLLGAWDLYAVWDRPQRVLHLFMETQVDNQWNENCRFLAVRK